MVLHGFREATATRSSAHPWHYRPIGVGLGHQDSAECCEALVLDHPIAEWTHERRVHVDLTHGVWTL